MLKEDKKTKTRKAILELLKNKGSQDSNMLAEEIGVSTMAIRQHLYCLKDEGFISYKEEPRPMGRPAKMWLLTEESNCFFPNSHADLTVSLLDSISDVFGNDGVEKIIEDRQNKQIDMYKKRLDPLPSFEEKLEELVVLRNSEGYMAESFQEDDNYFFVENNCPICSAAEKCESFCSAEQAVMQAVFGDDVSIDRIENIVKGSRRCVYIFKRK